MDRKKEHDEFVLLVIESQSRLYAYIRSLLLDNDRSRDVLQQTNLVLLEKESEFERGTNFGAWACKVAFYEVLADRRRRHRDKHLFSDELLSLVALRAAETTERFDERAVALEGCLEKLASKQRDLLYERYHPGGSVSSLAEKLGKSSSAVSAMLYRIRTSLMGCIERKLAGANGV